MNLLQVDFILTEPYVRPHSLHGYVLGETALWRASLTAFSRPLSALYTKINLVSENLM
jgi:hypothetical protein